MQEENQRKPVDASCSGYSAADGYTLVPADYGTTIDETALKNAVAEAVEGWRTHSTWRRAAVMWTRRWETTTKIFSP